MSFKTFSAVAKQWLQDYFEKYPDRREIIIPKFTSEQLDAEQGDDYINFKLREDSSQEIIDLIRKRILRSFNYNVVNIFLEEFDDTDIEFWGEFNDGVVKE